MTSDTSPYQHLPPPPPPPMAAARGWTGSDLATGGALVVLLIALFLPWFSGTVSAGSGTPVISGTGDGPASHGYLWAVFVLAIVALIVLVARDAIARVPGNLPSSEQMLVGATGLALLLTILGVALKPFPAAATSSVLLHFSVGWSYGGFVALVAALIAFVAAFRAGEAVRSGRRMTMPSLRDRGTTA